MLSTFYCCLIYELEIYSLNFLNKSGNENLFSIVYRFGCEAYLLRNLAELGFEEPTPIQRQAIPVLLSVRFLI